GTLTLVRAETDLAAVVREAIDMYSETADERGIAVAMQAPAPALVTGDPVRLGQVVANLLDNALKYTPRHGRVQVSVVPDDQGATLTVSDTGPGVPLHEREKIWRRLY